MPLRFRLSKNQGVQLDEARLRRQVKWLLLLRVCLLTLFIGTSSLLQLSHPGLRLPPPLAVVGFFAFVYLVTVLSAVLVNRLARLTTFTYLQITCDTVLSTVIVFASGGSESIFTFLYLFPVISAGLMFLRRGGLRMAGVAIVNYGVILLTEHSQLAPRLPAMLGGHPATSSVILLQSFLIYGLSFLLVGLLSAFLAERLYLTERALSLTSRDLNFVSQLYKQIFDDITSGIITVDSRGRITSVNHAAEEITGFPADQVLGCGLPQLFPGLQSQPPGEERPTVDLTRRDGRTIPVGYSWGRLNLPDSQEECRVYTLQDLSRIRQMEEQVRQSEKMAAIGKIAAGIAHEFRNPLAAISGAAQVLAQEEPASSANRTLLTIILRECGRLEANITDFLQFSKPALPEPAWVPLQGLIDECWAVLRQAGRDTAGCHLSCHLASNLDCWADPYQLKQVFLNLLHNSCQAMEGGGEIVIRAQEEADADGQVRSIITVSDSGSGIPANMLQDIFTPFFTTRDNGTGLGLAIVQQIVLGHRGTITVTSTPGQGTVFTLSLPLPI